MCNISAYVTWRKVNNIIFISCTEYLIEKKVSIKDFFFDYLKVVDDFLFDCCNVLL